MEKYILAVTGDCNDGDYLTKNTIIENTLENIKELKRILEKLKEVDRVCDYDMYYFDEIREVITDEEFNFMAKTFEGTSGEDDIDDDFVGETLYNYLPTEGQSGQKCHSIESVKILKEIA